jgi:predicted nucleotide-binding protein
LKNWTRFATKFTKLSLVFSPEAQTVIRKDKKFVPNMNVLFEFGYFYGHFGKEKVAMVRYGEFFLPSDFGGYIWIPASASFKRSAVVQVGAGTKTAFKKWGSTTLRHPPICERRLNQQRTCS